MFAISFLYLKIVLEFDIVRTERLQAVKLARKLLIFGEFQFENLQDWCYRKKENL